jgi:RHS repeat-associated protein
LTNSSLVDNVAFKNGGTTRMTTSNRFDNLNRLTRKASQTGAVAVATFNYALNTANQRTAITNADSSRWAYAYDTLGQVTSGKRYWSDGGIVAGQQFEYSFDDIGNRLTVASGGDQSGANLRSQNYSANNLNQYTQRTVPPYVDVQGSAHSNATVTVNLQSTYRKAEYFRAELSADNSSGPLWFGVTNVAVLTNGSGPDIVTTNEGNVLVAKATETFLHDLDGNLTSDSLWTNTWNGENRLIATESRTDVPSAGRAKETWTHLPDGRWIERVVANWNGSAYTNAYTNRFVWDGQVLLAILDHTNGLVSSFVRGLDLSGSIQGAGGVGGVAAVNIATNGVHFTAFDGNGNVSSLASSTDGAVTANYEYSPFGETLRANGVVAKANLIRFSTQFAGDVTGHKKYLHRDRMDAGRWLSRDLLGDKAFQDIHAHELRTPANNGEQLTRNASVELNLYRFVRNDPVQSVDVYGLDVWILKATGGFGHQWLVGDNPEGGYWASDFEPIPNLVFGRVCCKGRINFTKLWTTDPRKINARTAKEVGFVVVGFVKTSPNVDEKLRKFAEDESNKPNPPMYDALGNNCRDWAKKLLGIANYWQSLEDASKK